MIIFDSGSPSSVEANSFLSVHNGEPSSEFSEIYSKFPMDPWETPFGWLINKFTTYFYIDPDLAGLISSIYVCVRKDISTGDGGSILYEGIVPATLTVFIEPIPNTYPLYEIIAEPSSPIHLMDAEAIDIVDFWIATAPVFDPAIDLASYSYAITLAFAATEPEETTAFIYSDLEGSLLDLYFEPIASFIVGIADFSIKIEGTVYILYEGVCDGPNPPDFCSGGTHYPEICRGENYPPLCIPQLIPQPPEPGPEPEPEVISVRQFGSIKVNRVSGYWTPL